MPIPRIPDVISQVVPPEHRILEGIPEALALGNTRQVVKKALGLLGTLSSDIRVVERRKVYKLYWLLPDTGRGEVLVDSRSGSEVPMARSRPGSEPRPEDPRT